MKKCYLCHKKSSTGHAISHSHRRTKRKWSPNIQRALIFVDGKKIKAQLCTKCLKAQA